MKVNLHQNHSGDSVFLSVSIPNSRQRIPKNRDWSKLCVSRPKNTTPRRKFPQPKYSHFRSMALERPKTLSLPASPTDSGSADGRTRCPSSSSRKPRGKPFFPRGRSADSHRAVRQGPWNKALRPEVFSLLRRIPRGAMVRPGPRPWSWRADRGRVRRRIDGAGARRRCL